MKRLHTMLQMRSGNLNQGTICINPTKVIAVFIIFWSTSSILYRSTMIWSEIFAVCISLISGIMTFRLIVSWVKFMRETKHCQTMKLTILSEAFLKELLKNYTKNIIQPRFFMQSYLCYFKTSRILPVLIITE